MERQAVQRAAVVATAILRIQLVEARVVRRGFANAFADGDSAPTGGGPALVGSTQQGSRHRGS